MHRFKRNIIVESLSDLAIKYENIRSYPEKTAELFKAFKDKDPAFAIHKNVILTQSGNERKIVGRSVKVQHGEDRKVKTAVVYMAAADSSGFNVCPFATEGCKKACLGTTTGHFRAIEQNRVVQYLKLWYWKATPFKFLNKLFHEIVNLAILSKREGYTPAVRLNGSTDICWPRYIDFDAFNAVMKAELGIEIKFYDYTKWDLNSYIKRIGKAYRMPSMDNYHLTFSYSEDPKSYNRMLNWLDAGYSAAVVVRGHNGSIVSAKNVQKRLVNPNDSIQIDLNGRVFHAHNADIDDIRFWDPKGSIGILHAKGAIALNDETGFVMRFND